MRCVSSDLARNLLRMYSRFRETCLAKLRTRQLQIRLAYYRNYVIISLRSDPSIFDLGKNCHRQASSKQAKVNFTVNFAITTLDHEVSRCVRASKYYTIKNRDCEDDD